VLQIRIRNTGSRIRCLFDPWIRDSGWVKYQDRSRDEQLRNNFWVKILKFFDADTDPGWKKFGSGIQDKHPGSATLLFERTRTLEPKYYFGEKSCF
jgi:hypothetical protein